MTIDKSTRHQKIIGQFGENCICNWLSRSGFEVSIVDHTGIDIVAYNSKTKERIGITVKSRTRNIGKESEAVNIFTQRNNKNDRKKLLDACEAFASEPYIGIYVETNEYADIFLTSLRNYDEKYRKNKNRLTDTWKMRKKDLLEYSNDPKIRHVKVDFNSKQWRW